MQKTWGKKDESFLPKNTVPTLKHGIGSVIFGGSFNSGGTEQLIATREIINSDDYIKILVENLQLSEQNLDLGRRFTFQQDNDPKYTC